MMFICEHRERPGVKSLCQHSNPESKGVVNAGDLQAPFSPLPAQSIILTWLVQVLFYSWVSTGQGGVTSDCGMGWLSWVWAEQLHNTQATLQDKLHIISGKPGFTRNVMQRSLCMCGACNFQNTFDSLTFNEIFSSMVLQQASQLF